MIKLECNSVDCAMRVLDLSVDTHLDEASFDAGRVLDQHHFLSVFHSARVQKLSILSLFASVHHSLFIHPRFPTQQHLLHFPCHFISCHVIFTLYPHPIPLPTFAFNYFNYHQILPISTRFLPKHSIFLPSLVLVCISNVLILELNLLKFFKMKAKNK